MHQPTVLIDAKNISAQLRAECSFSLALFSYTNIHSLLCNADLNAGVENTLSHSNNQQMTQKAHKPTMKLQVALHSHTSNGTHTHTQTVHKHFKVFSVQLPVSFSVLLYFSFEFQNV